MTAFTLEQRAVVDRRSGSVLVSANAGSGKTSVMVERFVEAVREDGVPVDAILAITFTDKAAAQLRARIRARFGELGEEEAARVTERAHVSTIHGFCARVLRGNAVAAGLDPDFQVLDEVRSVRLARSAFARALDELVAAGGDAATELVAAYTAEALRETVVGLHDRLRSAGQTQPVLPAPRPRDVEAALAQLRAALPEATDCVALARTARPWPRRPRPSNGRPSWSPPAPHRHAPPMPRRRCSRRAPWPRSTRPRAIATGARWPRFARLPRSRSAARARADR